MFCPNCGTTNADDAHFCVLCGHDLHDSVPGPATAAPAYAGFLERLAALFIDGFILFGANIATTMVLAAMLIPTFANQQDSSGLEIVMAVIYLLPLLISALYFTLMESGAQGATLGKRALKIRVVDMQGNRLGKGRALGRWFAHGLSNFSLAIGYLIQPLTAKKQALHDLIAGTLVVRPDPKSNTKTLAIIVVALTVAISLIMVGLMAAMSFATYGDYRARAAVAQGYAAAQQAEIAVAEYYLENGRYPSSLAETQANLTLPTQVSEMILVPGTGELKLTFAASQPRSIAGKSIIFSHDDASAGNIPAWQCRSDDIPVKLLPRACHPPE
jgi:uncharacterized RDD family membrane protein YckC/type II secretory pathway pseudopilin PulG